MSLHVRVDCIPSIYERSIQDNACVMSHDSYVGSNPEDLAIGTTSHERLINIFTNVFVYILTEDHKTVFSGKRSGSRD